MEFIIFEVLRKARNQKATPRAARNVSHRVLSIFRILRWRDLSGLWGRERRRVGGVRVRLKSVFNRSHLSHPSGEAIMRHTWGFTSLSPKHVKPIRVVR